MFKELVGSIVSIGRPFFPLVVFLALDETPLGEGDRDRDLLELRWALEVRSLPDEGRPLLEGRSLPDEGRPLPDEGRPLLAEGRPLEVQLVRGHDDRSPA